jgi:hypothetical protein
MSVSRIRYVALTGLSLLALAGCRQSRVNDMESVDVCQLVTSVEAERVFGPLTEDPVTTNGGAFAGGCSWSFRPGATPASVSAYVMTRASAANLMTTPKGWFEDPVRLGDVKANLGEPNVINGLGYVAWLYGTTLFVRKGEIVIVLHTDHGEVAQMEKLAQTLLSPR